MAFKEFIGSITKEVNVETKKRRLLRAACITWLIISLMLSIKSIYADTFHALQLSVNLITVLVIFIILLIDLKGYNKLARYLVTFALSLSIISSAYFILPGKNIELFLIILGPFSVFFIDKSWVQYLVFSVSFGVFLFLPGLLGIDSEVQKFFNLKIIFVYFFFLMKDVDGINRRSEQLLKDQKKRQRKIGN